MSLERKIKYRTKRRIQRVRNKLSASGLPKVSVFRSLNHIYAQIIDDAQQKTIVSCSSLELKNLTGDKKQHAHSVGLELAKRAKEQNISNVVLDRGRYLYHGRIQALVDGLRQGGLAI